MGGLPRVTVMIVLQSPLFQTTQDISVSYQVFFHTNTELKKSTRRYKTDVQRQHLTLTHSEHQLEKHGVDIMIFVRQLGLSQGDCTVHNGFYAHFSPSCN